MRVTFVCLLTGLFILSGCGTVPVMVYNDYQGKSINPKKVAVMIDNTKLNFWEDIVSDIHDDLPKKEGQPAESIYVNYLKKMIDGEVKTQFSGAKVEFLSVSDHKEQFERKRIQYAKDEPESEYLLPVSAEKFKQITDAQLVVIISSVKINRKTKFFNTGTSKTSSDYLSSKYEYSVWDNEEGKLVSSGSPLIENSFMFAMTTSTWDSNVKDFIQFVFKNPPMGVKRVK